MNIQAALGMPVEISYPGKAGVFKSSDWPDADAMQDMMIAEYRISGSDGHTALSVAILNDHRDLYAKLRHARSVLMVVATLVTLVFIGIALSVFRLTTVRPLRNLTQSAP